jgi:hypothetical protein
MNLYIAGLVAGLLASMVWAIINLIVDAAFLPVIRRHTDQLNERLMAKPALTLLVLIADVAFWGTLFGFGYALMYPAFKSWSALSSGVVWGLVMFVSFSRAMVESTLFTKVPRDMNVFWFVEGLAGLVVWGAALELIFAWIN